MKQKLRLILTAALATVFVVSMTMVVRQQLQYRANAESYEEAAQIAQFTPPKTIPKPTIASSSQTAGEEGEKTGDSILDALAGIDLDALREVNPDVVGWIYIPNTELSYPLLYGSDNSYYLNRSWDRKYNSGGSIFFDYRCSPDFEDFNTVIYGHRMGNESMFGTLKHYKNPGYWQEHPDIYVVSDTGIYVYSIFSAWEPSVLSVVYEMRINSEQKKQEFIDTCIMESQLDTGIDVGTADKFLTLSTCTGRGHATRWVVQAILTQRYSTE